MSDPRNWCLRAIPGREFEVRDRLTDRGLTILVAEKIIETRVSRHRWKRETVPVLPGYMRATCDDDQWHEIGKCNLVRGSTVRPLVVNCFPMSRRDVADFLKLEAKAARGDFNPDGPLGHLKPGAVMQVVGGVFEGLQFSFERVRRDRVIGHLDVLGKFVRAELSVDDLDWKAAG